MKITIGENDEKALEKLANENGMFAPEFTLMVLREVTKNAEHRDYYGKIAQKIIKERIRASDEYFANRCKIKTRRV